MLDSDELPRLPRIAVHLVVHRALLGHDGDRLLYNAQVAEEIWLICRDAQMMFCTKEERCCCRLRYG